ncbi:MAG: glycosyltransferase [Burkholderiaceae bacterium]
MPDLRGGGAERVAVNLANTLSERDYRVDMVLMHPSGQLLDALSPKVRVVSLGAPRVRQALWPLVRYLRSAQPAAVLANMWPLTVMAVLARRLANVQTRVAVAEHTTWSRS